MSFLPTGLNTSSLTARERRLRRYGAVFWSLQALVFAAALTVRLASPSVILMPIQTLQPMPVVPSNVCTLVNSKLVGILQTSRSDLPALTERVTDLGTFLQITQSRLPSVPDARYTPEFIGNVRTLRQTCKRWERRKLTAAEAVDLQAELVSYRNRFNRALLNIPKPAPLWYIHTVRAATGFLEGLAAPALLPVRAATCALSGRLTARAVLAPEDWRRTGPFFVLLLFYGTLLTAYLSAWLAQHFHRYLLFIPGLLGVLYSAGLVVYELSRRF